MAERCTFPRGGGRRRQVRARIHARIHARSPRLARGEPALPHQMQSEGRERRVRSDPAIWEQTPTSYTKAGWGGNKESIGSTESWEAGSVSLWGWAHRRRNERLRRWRERVGSGSSPHRELGGGHPPSTPLSASSGKIPAPTTLSHLTHTPPARFLAWPHLPAPYRRDRD